MRDMSLIVRDRVVRAVVCNPRSSQDETVTPVERLRYHNSGKRWRAKNLEASTYCKLIDAMLLRRTPSSSGVNVDRMDARRDLFLHRRWRDRIASHAARSRSVSRRGPSKGVKFELLLSTRSTGAVPERLYRRDHFVNVLPQKLQSSGVREATSNQ